jgi:ATP-binding cassette subfamily B protein IrtB
MITHRLKAVRHADQILVVEIKDKSSNKEHLMNLMEQDGIYRRFISGRKQAAGWKLQSPSPPRA